MTLLSLIGLFVVLFIGLNGIAFLLTLLMKNRGDDLLSMFVYMLSFLSQIELVVITLLINELKMIN